MPEHRYGIEQEPAGIERKSIADWLEVRDSIGGTEGCDLNELGDIDNSK